MQVEFAQQVFDVNFHRAVADTQLARYQLVAQTLGDQCQGLPLTLGKIGSLRDAGKRIADEERDWQFGTAANYLLPRQDSHAWLLLTGEHVAAVMAKLCGVDLRPEAFPPGAVAQTSAARINVIVINLGEGDLPCFQLLCDRASAHYFWDALLDAMAEFGGQPAGINALL